MSRPRAATSVAISSSAAPARKLLHHAVALLLRHAAVQRLGLVAARVERLGELVDLGARAAEDERRGRRLEVEDAAEGAPSCCARGTRYACWRTFGDFARLRWRLLDADAQRIALVALGDRLDARRHRSGEEHRLALRRRFVQHRLDVLGESHVEHLVGLVEHDDAHPAHLERAAADVIERAAGRGDHDIDAGAQAHATADRSAGPP